MKEYLYNLATDKRQGVIAAILKFLLLLVSFIYGAMIRGLILFFSLRPYRLKCKVISVGNITLGGTGKTSLVELIAGYLKNKCHRVAVLSRGYKKNSVLTEADEPAMLLKSLGDIPVIVDKDRVRSGLRAINEYGVDTVILDDGLQQWRLKKDLEIVTINASQGLVNRHMLPRGILREPLSALRRADIFVLTKTDLSGNLEGIKSSLKKINPLALVVESIHQGLGFYDMHKPGELLNLKYLEGRPVALLSGIGDPDSFAELIRVLGINACLDLRFSDHHNYTRGDLADINCKAKEKGLGIIVTTEKDAARLSWMQPEWLGGYQVLVLRIALKITKNEERFFARLLSLYPL